MKKTEQFGKLAIEEIIVDRLEEVKDIEAYRYLCDIDRRNWKINTVRKILSIRKKTSRLMTFLDVCMFLLIGSAIYHFVISKNVYMHCIVAVAFLVIDFAVKKLMDHIETVYIQKSILKQEQFVLDLFSVK